MLLLLAIHLDQFVLLTRLLDTFLALVVDAHKDEHVEQEQETADDHGDGERGVVVLELTVGQATQ